MGKSDVFVLRNGSQRDSKIEIHKGPERARRGEERDGLRLIQRGPNGRLLLFPYEEGKCNDVISDLA